ncbi:L-threonylcarbamoyladenylate synthase [Temperatibacter marinus]|uniref:Threonylcarbamoyl-AMP synthase n=1 Tax=Temperatibacter marinus TaxID=1456591 RepID=A0AA52EG60_9PROT|nr:L-threonylcarbamoyladenylate synthase [Temperatibacter marinus]WND01932.1 L-threonylcarbamoyladenylate synthase [Temperatibacter marinus]
MIIKENAAGAKEKALDLLSNGELVAIPTETVYGLAADASNEQAVALIYAAKGRPSYNPLICHVSDIEMAARYVDIKTTAQKLIDKFWPGPLTFVLPRKQNCSLAKAVSAGLDTLAVRCPQNETIRALIAELNKPIAAPSANPSGKISPTCAADVEEGLGSKVSLILDGGPCVVGLESTIISIENNKISLLRPGTIQSDEIAAVAKCPVFDREGSEITAPGQLSSHYAPNTQVTLKYSGPPNDDIFIIGFGDNQGNLNLSAKGHLEEAGRNLFASLRKADQAGKKAIAVVPIPATGIGIAINDRLKRAAAPKDHA